MARIIISWVSSVSTDEDNPTDGALRADKFPLDVRPFYTMPDPEDNVSDQSNPPSVLITEDAISATVQLVRLLPARRRDLVGRTAHTHCALARRAHESCRDRP